MKLNVMLAALLFTGFSLAQEKPAVLKIDNAVIISHLDKQADRFSLEIALSETFTNNKIKNILSLNLLKEGADPQVFLTDSMQTLLASKGFNTLCLVSVRGYDKKFQKSTTNFTLAEDLAAENLFPLYKEDIVSVTLEFHFYQQGKLVHTDLLKISGASSREKVLKKLRKKLPKKIQKDWK